MCGICGIVQPASRGPVAESELVAMRDVITHRGPDDSGSYADEGLALGSRRLSILDLSAHGHMPMGTPDGRYWIVHNGEVYNYDDFRSELETRGYRFRSHSDTEVLLYLYAEYGAAMLPRLNGMFAFAIWDARERELFVARDRLGVKPLYYSERGGRLAFASEEKALFAAGVTPRFDHGTWEELLCFRYVAGERTPFSGVSRLLPGHYLRWRDGDLRITRWWSLAERARELRETPLKDPVGWFRETFDDSVRLRRISDVPVGVLLSGGLDSSSVAASLAAVSDDRVGGFTVRFDESYYDEFPLAQQVARKWGLDHHALTVRPEQLLEGLREAAWLQDEPLAHANELHMLAISRYAKDFVTVLLSGEGADETMCGYVRYQPLRYRRAIQLARPLLRWAAARAAGGRVRKMSRFLELGSWDEFALFNSCDLLPPELEVLGLTSRDEFPYRRALLAEGAGLYPGDSARQAMFVDQHTFLGSLLDRNDRMTMGASIECRVPFLDYRLVEGLAAMRSDQLFAGRRNKPLMRKAVGSRLPDDVLKGRKWGFGVPWSAYFRSVPEIRAMIETLPTAEPIASGPFDRARVTETVREFLAGNAAFEPVVRQLLMVRVWYETCVTPGSRVRPVAAV